MTTRTFPDGCTVSITTTNTDWHRPSNKYAYRFGRLHRMLLSNGMGKVIAPHVKVELQDRYPSSASIGDPSAMTIYLRGVGAGGVDNNGRLILDDNGEPVPTTFSTRPDAQLGHEFGHVAMAWMFWKIDIVDYLRARQLTREVRLDTAYHWSLDEIAAEDWRLINGSPLAISQRDAHICPDIPDPRTLPALVDLLTTWRAEL